MGLKIVYSKNAKQDVKAIYGYIRRDSITYAKKELNSIYVAIRRLSQNPLLGKKFEKSIDELTREMIFKIVVQFMILLKIKTIHSYHPPSRPPH